MYLSEKLVCCLNHDALGIHRRDHAIDRSVLSDRKTTGRRSDHLTCADRIAHRNARHRGSTDMLAQPDLNVRKRQLFLVTLGMLVEAIYTEKEQSRMMATVGSYKRWSPEKAKDTIESRGLTCVIVGEGELVTGQYPAAGTEILKETGKVILYLGNAAPTTVKVPNLIGMSAETANQYLRYYDLNVTIVGPMNETVYAQSIAPGTEVPIGTAVELTFRSMAGDENPDYD